MTQPTCARVARLLRPNKRATSIQNRKSAWCIRPPWSNKVIYKSAGENTSILFMNIAGESAGKNAGKNAGENAGHRDRKMRVYHLLLCFHYNTHILHSTHFTYPYNRRTACPSG